MNVHSMLQVAAKIEWQNPSKTTLVLNGVCGRDSRSFLCMFPKGGFLRTVYKVRYADQAAVSIQGWMCLLL
jgi:hypothetical protein